MNDEASRNDALIFGRVCVGCLIGKQKKPIPFKVTEPSSIPLRLIKTNLKWIQIGSEQLRNVYCEYVIQGNFSHLKLCLLRCTLSKCGRRATAGAARLGAAGPRICQTT